MVVYLLKPMIMRINPYVAEQRRGGGRLEEGD
jgi:hypothetical protein